MLEVSDLQVAYGDVGALWGVSLHVDPGTIVAIVGANGAGKTTLLRTVSGLLKPKSGDIRLAGQSLVGKAPQEIASMGIAHVPEGRGLFRQMTVLENLELGAFQPKARPRTKVLLDKAYALFPRLKERVHQKAGSLSGGEQQMLAIARATMSEPSLLILDEPSLGLSPLVVQQMFSLIQTLHAQGVTILLVEQNIHQALKVADYAFVLQTGSLAMQGTGAELIADPEIQKAYMGVLE
ncbi:branched-chain amino acid ABC transporter ATP-binding protein [Mesorhizobium sp. WSM4312]|uniref:ABC transporter ATP-binding protein n=1 Tax=unclassified Mesorhizobium TaxID=325217 RepID=UPI000BB02AB1|nr:branched-chain amino acid ABC transporter ATP-binding protein [Mesorhizobium sp. WSM4312]PBC19401.1 branched-chain amino acid ABC transporter ATP-binding protein [Mesorhizobium sp. WSM4311]TRC77750.1 ABC transporter ATP-binding protein [Mesorhizobium sp. WSM4310]TRC78192.1 ABC transporter ATP-binding protein [Mesorhizobium sp. WSM4315]TRC79361.1 ABC transporter ATP-binding protein [Mesorhizobium sp. WSM4307]TRD00273.1 ABC transporter ATP-binding protein [Mesorhizobium sp. WSM4305]